MSNNDTRKLIEQNAEMQAEIQRLTAELLKADEEITILQEHIQALTSTTTVSQEDQ